jgi:leucyl aminopeptidase
MAELVFTTRSGSIADQKTPCLIVPMERTKKLPARLADLDEALSQTLTRIIKQKDFSGNSKEVMVLSGNERFPRIILLGLGNAERSPRDLRQCLSTLWGTLAKLSCSQATIDLAGFERSDFGDIASAVTTELTKARYVYRTTLSTPKPVASLKKITLLVPSNSAQAAAKVASRRALATAQGVNMARELANLPGNICTPSYLAEQALQLAQEYPNLTTEVLSEKQMYKLGMHSLLSVSAGSAEEAKLIVIQYQGTTSTAQPHCLVGKGITFDTGGISLKPGAKMDEMKFDMGGAASVLGTVKAIAELGLEINVVAIVAAAENMPSGTATKPGDVVTSMSGQTIEILNTDAEGRLVLCDALTYAERFSPLSVVDIATLTGACVVALGHHATGLYANNDALANALLAAGEKTGDRAWRMPLWDEYQSQLDSPYADIGNIGGPAAGSVTAACFLSRFTKKYAWAHLDIAGSAWNSAPKGATGRPVELLTEYLANASMSV